MSEQEALKEKQVKDMKVFWLVWSPRGRLPSKKHRDREAAMTEALRLSEVHPGRHFYVMEMIGWEMKGSETLTAAQAKRQDRAAEKRAS